MAVAQYRFICLLLPADCTKSVRNRCTMLPRCFFDLSADVGAFVIGLSQISSFFSAMQPEISLNFHRNNVYVHFEQVCKYQASELKVKVDTCSTKFF